MPIITPRGLVIRMEAPTAFTLLARLWNRDRDTDALHVLRTCEAMESLQSMIAFAAGAIAVFWPGRPVWTITAALVVGKLFALLLNYSSVFALPRALSGHLIVRIWSELLGFGLRHVLAVVVLLVWFDGQAALAWAVGVVLSELARFAVQRAMGRRLGGHAGHPLDGNELHFIAAYQLHARRLGISEDIRVTDEEIHTGHWRDCLADMGSKHPVEVDRFI